MKKSQLAGLLLAGFSAGAINGLFGAGGGLVLVPLLSIAADLEEQEIFPASISIMLPICLVSLSFLAASGLLDLKAALPYLIGSALGGLCAGIWGQRLPVTWLHHALGILILWGGIRYLC